MPAGLSVDTDLVRAYGATSARHAGDLQAVAARLAGVRADDSALGPVGAGFLAALNRAACREAAAVDAAVVALRAAHLAAHGSAEAYEVTDGAAGARMFGGR